MAGKIKMTIDPFGNPKIEAEGFTGTSCEQATRGIEAALSNSKSQSDRTLKPEYFQQEEQQVEQEYTSY